MESMLENHLLKLPLGAIENIRKIHDLDTPGRLKEAINILEEWIQKQDHIVKKDFSKDYLEKTLISCKGSVEKSKKQIDQLCTMKTMVPKFFSKTNLKMELHNILDIAWVIPLPKVIEDYYRVTLIKINNKTFTAENFMQFYQYSIIVSEYIKANDYANGFIVIYDYTQLNLLDMLSKMNTVELQQFVTILIEGYGARLKGIHILTDSKAVELLFKIVKQFVSEKIGNRMHVQPTLEDLHKVVPKEILPVEYGGNERSIDKFHGKELHSKTEDSGGSYLNILNTNDDGLHSKKANDTFLS